MYADDLPSVYSFKKQSLYIIENKINSGINNMFLLTLNRLLNLSMGRRFHLKIGFLHEFYLSVNVNSIFKGMLVFLKFLRIN